MGIFSNLLDRDMQKAIQRYEAENKRKSFNVNANNSKVKDFLVKTVGFINSHYVGREMLAPPEYDFEEINNKYLEMAEVK